MQTILPDGRVFETQPFLKIDFLEDEKVYKYVFETKDRTVKSSAGHEWGVWDNVKKEILMKKMTEIKIGIDELLIQRWE